MLGGLGGVSYLGWMNLASVQLQNNLQAILGLLHAAPASSGFWKRKVKMAAQWYIAPTSLDGLQGAFAWECWNNSDWIQLMVGKWSRFQKLCSELFCFKYLGFSICSRTRNSVATTTSGWLNSICCQVDTHENAVTMASSKSQSLDMNILYLKYSC